jgi:nucleotide-binding universal stress UspA family protein
MSLILAAVDFEAASTRALEVAKQMAAVLGDEVVLVHVYQVPVYTYPGFEPAVFPNLQAEVMNAAKRALEELAAEHGGLRSVLHPGDPAHEILEVARELSPRMIVMGTHGRRGLAHVLLGSVAERVIRRSSAPVLTVPSKEAQAARQRPTPPKSSAA